MKNKTLETLIKLYATGSHDEVREFLLGLSKDTLAATLTDAVTLYINDKNSSTLREWLTLVLAGYQPVEEKLGYNGYRMAGPGTVVREYCEVKPLNVYRKEDGSWSRKLNGGGNFSDYTPERLAKDLQQEKLQMLTSGFVEGKLLYIIQFPFFCLEEKLRSVLKRRFPTGRGANEYLRSASFTYKDYQDCSRLTIVYRTSELKRYRSVCTRGFYKFLAGEENDA